MDRYSGLHKDMSTVSARTRLYIKRRAVWHIHKHLLCRDSSIYMIQSIMKRAPLIRPSLCNSASSDTSQSGGRQVNDDGLYCMYLCILRKKEILDFKDTNIRLLRYRTTNGFDVFPNARFKIKISVPLCSSERHAMRTIPQCCCIASGGN